MKKAFKRTMSMVLALIMCFTLFAVSASAATAKNVKTYKNYVQLGDSIAVGFSLPDFNRSNYRFRRIKGTYADRLAKDVKAKHYYAYAQLGFRTSDIRVLLDNSYNGDELTNTELPLNSDGTNLAQLKKWRSRYQKAVKNADLITLDVGFNDFWLPFIGMTHGNENPVQAVYQYLLGFETNYAKILERIYALNPDVKVVLVGTYNPCKHWDFPVGSGVYFGALMNPMWNTINAYKKVLANKYGNKVVYADVSDVEVYTEGTPVASDGGFDPHPTLKGHKYMEKQILAQLPTK